MNAYTKLVLVGLTLACALSAAPCPAAAKPRRAPKSIVVSYYEGEDLARIMSGLEGSHARVFVGSYGINGGIARKVHAHPRGIYAPIFQPKTDEHAVSARDVTNEEQRRLEKHNKEDKLTGPMPPWESLLSLAPAARAAWGREVGKRYRDHIRNAARKGIRVDSWQFDEIFSEVAYGASQKAHRLLIAAILHGLYHGRSALGDTPMRGIVWAPLMAVRLANSSAPDVDLLLAKIDEVSLLLAGEEYPAFTGDPTSAAWVQGAGLRALKAGDAVRRRLAAKYVCGMTPGHSVAPGLGGNVYGLSRKRVSAWREGYIAARRAAGVRSFGEFSLVGEDGRKGVVDDIIAALRFAVGAPSLRFL